MGNLCYFMFYLIFSKKYQIDRENARQLKGYYTAIRAFFVFPVLIIGVWCIVNLNCHSKNHYNHLQWMYVCVMVFHLCLEYNVVRVYLNWFVGEINNLSHCVVGKGITKSGATDNC